MITYQSVLESVTALGTLAAVIVALILGVVPIIREAKARSLKSWYMTEQLTAILMPMYLIFKLNCDRPIIFKGIVALRERFDEFKAVYLHLDVLPIAVMNDVNRLYILLNVGLTLEELSIPEAKRITDALEAVLKRTGALQ
jgi:hypothetical protein